MLFCLADDHLHTALAADRARAGRLAQAVFLALQPLLAVPLEPATDRAIFAAGVVRLAAAASSAAAVGPMLKGSSAPVVRARSATIQIGCSVGFSTADLARVLSVTSRTVRAYRRTDAYRPLVRAVRIRLALEYAVGQPNPA